MADPYFKLRQEVHVVRNHCVSCSQLESQMQHPIKVRAIMACGEGFTYRIEDAKGACFNVNEACLCCSASGHELNPCVFCARASPDRAGSCARWITIQENQGFVDRIDNLLRGS